MRYTPSKVTGLLLLALVSPLVGHAQDGTQKTQQSLDTSHMLGSIKVLSPQDGAEVSAKSVVFSGYIDSPSLPAAIDWVVNNTTNQVKVEVDGTWSVSLPLNAYGTISIYPAKYGSPKITIVRRAEFNFSGILFMLISWGGILVACYWTVSRLLRRSQNA